jgi:hypothetical protein
MYSWRWSDQFPRTTRTRMRACDGVQGSRTFEHWDRRTLVFMIADGHNRGVGHGNAPLAVPEREREGGNHGVGVSSLRAQANLKR